VCAYDSKTGYAYLEVTLVGDSYELAAVASITDSVGAAKTPFVKVSDDTWRTSQWLPDNGAGEITFSGSLETGLNGAVYPYEATYNDGLDSGNCGYINPRIVFNSWDYKLSDGICQVSLNISVQPGVTATVSDANGASGTPGHAEYTTWTADGANPLLWRTTLTRDELTKQSGTTFIKVVDSRGLEGGGWNPNLLTYCG
jgi:hypothetical protein